MRFGLPLTIGLLLAAPAQSANEKAQPATEAEQKEAVDKWVRCLREKVAELDDGSSDVQSVGAAVAPLCANLVRETAEVFARGKSARVREMLEERWRIRSRETAATLVLQARANRR